MIDATLFVLQFTCGLSNVGSCLSLIPIFGGYQMSEIKCPDCGSVFTVDKTSYTNILMQVHDKEFEDSVEKQVKQINEKKTLEFINEKNELKDDYDQRILVLKKEKEDREKEIDRIINMRTKLSTKMVGETLEQHCEIEFDKLRVLFPRSYFEKDNDSTGGSKGDYIFRDYDENENEIISIMFEMKNQASGTVTKKRNEDFLKELDKDRNDKKCEYAVLVSLLEDDNELYNSGIVDKSHRYNKMYVVRPNFFIPIITLLRNAAMNSLEIKKELSTMQEQNVDLTNFEKEIETFKQKFGSNYTKAHDRFDDAIKQIDNSIRSLEKTKDALLKSDNQLRLANDKAQDLSVKRLTKNSPSIAAELKKNQ